MTLVYAQYAGDPEDTEANIIDLVTDLLHLCDQYGLEQDYVERCARHHYNAEKHEESLSA